MIQPFSDEQIKRQQEFFNRARKGVLKYLNDKGGVLNMTELHDYSMNTFFIQHQGFSRMMETFVNEALVTYDAQSQDTFITESGKKFVESP